LTLARCGGPIFEKLFAASLGLIPKKSIELPPAIQFLIIPTAV
jgi:hypothetical protein